MVPVVVRVVPVDPVVVRVVPVVNLTPVVPVVGSGQL